MKKDSSGRPRGRASRHLHAPGQVRLIGGRWRGSKLPVADIEGLRPTSDRVRETLFNWLMPVLPGARVLDLFAGSGALGLEALSRGAATATLVERDPLLATALAQVAARLPGGEAATVVQADALAWLPAQPRGSFDIAFLDPPFSAGLWEQAL
ncbi:MAG: 16S rRNA (guanine(966)-N(2))-methyltransferase RsmD, partial [Lysobacter spongiicola]|nr:16S rRNA (guanine(966)-N(2))-methyltransferase RsmD [Lysobacter spongiicola]